MPCSAVSHAEFCGSAGDDIWRRRTLRQLFFIMRFELYVFIFLLHPSAPIQFGFTSLPYGTSLFTFYSFLYSRHVSGWHAVQYHMLNFVDLQVKAFEGAAHFASFSWQCALHLTFLYFYFIRQPHFRLVLYLSLTVHQAYPLHFSPRTQILYCSGASTHHMHAFVFFHIPHFVRSSSVVSNVWVYICSMCLDEWFQQYVLPFSLVLFCFSSVY